MAITAKAAQRGRSQSKLSARAYTMTSASASWKANAKRGEGLPMVNPFMGLT